MWRYTAIEPTVRNLVSHILRVEIPENANILNIATAAVFSVDYWQYVLCCGVNFLLLCVGVLKLWMADSLRVWERMESRQVCERVRGMREHSTHSWNAWCLFVCVVSETLHTCVRLCGHVFVLSYSRSPLFVFSLRSLIPFFLPLPLPLLLISASSQILSSYISSHHI